MVHAYALKCCRGNSEQYLKLFNKNESEMTKKRGLRVKVNDEGMCKKAVKSYVRLWYRARKCTAWHIYVFGDPQESFQSNLDNPLTLVHLFSKRQTIIYCFTRHDLHFDIAISLSISPFAVRSYAFIPSV